MLFDGQGDWCAVTWYHFFLLHLSTKIENNIFSTFRKCVGNKPDQSHIWVLAFIYFRIGFHLFSWLLS
jgi:hypothetical protein